jgi:predicted O-linked N-acetylglucosamine transferase (SPINDLY family)
MTTAPNEPQTQSARAAALYQEGITALQAGQALRAVDLIGQSLDLDPGQPVAASNLGAALLQLNRAEEALDRLEHALRLRPEYPSALYNRGNALQSLKRPFEALASYEQAIALRPDFVEALHNRGDVLRQLRRHEDALRSYDLALHVMPAFPLALVSRGNVLLELSRYEDALASFDHALELQPDYASALNSRGNALARLKRYQEAVDAYQRALRLKPNYAEALNNLGNTLRLLHRYDDALSCYERALQMRPDYALAAVNSSSVLQERGRHEEVLGFARLLEGAPDIDYALGQLHHSRLHCCDWTDWVEHTRTIVAAVQAGKRADAPFPFLAVSDSPQLQLQCARMTVMELVRRPATAAPRPYRHERLRVAYLSADFQEHPVARLAAALVERHDRKRVQTIGVALQPPQRAGSAGERMCRAFEHFHDASDVSDLEVAEWLRQQEVDIAVDLTGHTSGGRPGILAFRPASAQVSYLGYPGTLGADWIDYLLADLTVIPPEDEHAYSERIVRLPHCYLPYDDQQSIEPQPARRAEVGLPDSGFVFCAFNSSYKIAPPMFDVWMRLLASVPRSVLWLRARNTTVIANLRREAGARGIAPDRLIFAPQVASTAQHLGRLQLADLFLDTSPYGAHATASDALWAALPVVTYQGMSFAGRVGASLLRTLGLPELITSSLPAYEALALALAESPAKLGETRRRLAHNRHADPLFDTPRLCRELEAAYFLMMERCREGRPPASFNVPSQ